MKSEYANYQGAGIELNGMFAWDERNAARRPGILVVHAATGLDDHPKGRARRFAELGYVAFACDLFGPGMMGNRERSMAVIKGLRDAPSQLLSRVSTGLEVLRAHPLVDGRIAAIGYCFGGLTVLHLARSGADLAGVVSVHGTLATSTPAEPGKLRAKILVCHGALDPHVPMTQVSAFVEEMNRAGGDWQLAMYGGAKHGFAHENGPGFPGVEYNALADFRSSALIRDFISELFGPAT